MNQELPRLKTEAAALRAKLQALEDQIRRIELAEWQSFQQERSQALTKEPFAWINVQASNRRAAYARNLWSGPNDPPKHTNHNWIPVYMGDHQMQLEG